MHKKLVNIRAKRVVGRYKTYTEFSRHASKSEKKVVLESTLLEANKLQRTTIGLK
jgi:hypothetical protein